MKRLLTLVVFLVVGVFLVSSPAFSQSVINACVKVNQGQVRIVPADQPCGPSELRVVWNVTGPKGDPGPEGPPGPAGTPNTGTIQGQLTSCASGEASTRLVTLLGQSFTAVTDSGGNFAFRNVPWGIFSLSANVGPAWPQLGQVQLTSSGQTPYPLTVNLTDVQSNPQHCGACGRACNPGEVCQGGTCVNVSGNLVLPDRGSYHFLTGALTIGDLRTGDFYFGFYTNGSPGGTAPTAQFWANNLGQRGLADLGDLGSTPLSDVEVPAWTNYTHGGVTAVVGHVYVSLARQGEEGHYIIFRVVNIVANQYVELVYEYR